MTYLEFCNKIANLDLQVKVYSEKNWGIGYKNVANPMLYFNPLAEEKDYTGDVSVKAINSRMFDANELKQCLILIDALMLTQRKERGDQITFPMK